MRVPENSPRQVASAPMAAAIALQSPPTGACGAS